jgi:hypothetical protein
MASPEPVRLLEKPAYAYCTVSSSKMEDHMQKVCTGIHPMAHAQGWLATLIGGCGRASCLGEFLKEMAIGNARSWMRATALPSLSVLHTDT